MAIIKSSLAPRIRKRVGDTVFKRRLGQTIASQYNPVIKNPKTAKQVAQRAKFKIMIGLVQFSKFFLSTIFPRATYKGTKFNKLSKFLLKKIQDVTYPLTNLTYNNFNGTAVGNGYGFNIIPLTVVAHAGKSVTITWDITKAPVGAPLTGLINVMAINMTRKQTSFEQEIFAFSAGTGIFFAAAPPFTLGDSVIFAIGQTYTDAAGKVQQSQMTFQTVVAPIIIIA